MAENNLFFVFGVFERFLEYHYFIYSTEMDMVIVGVIMSIRKMRAIIVAYDSKDHGVLLACLDKTIYQKEKYQNFYEKNNCL